MENRLKQQKKSLEKIPRNEFIELFLTEMKIPTPTLVWEGAFIEYPEKKIVNK
jgi:hypothetical protein